MTDNHAPTASREFVAQPPFFGGKSKASETVISLYSTRGRGIAMIIGSIVAVGLFLFVVRALLLPRADSEIAQKLPSAIALGGVLLVLAFGALALWRHFRRAAKGILLTVTSDGLTVSERPGDVYTFSGAKLGRWGRVMGTALHLQCGQRRFVLGGRDHRVGAETRLEAPDVDYGRQDVDAWLWAEDFDEVLSMARRGGLDVRPPAPEEPTRCQLFRNPQLMQNASFKVQWGYWEWIKAPSLLIDVSDAAISFIDPKRNAIIVSVSPGHVTATPVMYGTSSYHLLPDAGHVVSDALVNHLSPEPAMVVPIPGVPPLEIACHDYVGWKLRFSWRGNVPTLEEPAAYTVSGADWLTLVQAFGLAHYVEDARHAVR